ncbi:two pore domain potassium channel family protein [Micromonospora costi]|uniref:Two pore domain potassium channel family protein n=2 Tax=Micromonospora costi TaxID=1530042 RepID=A0A3A9ZWJ5_9ACTN|nr:potassium channel family protein [Micromonospora costi]RKN52204.1 two pore domain potassium channel family protein [Micromonospora costi]
MVDRGEPHQRLGRAERWERLSGAPLTVLSLVFLAVYAAPILEPGLDDRWRAACEGTALAIWVLFWAELLVRFALAADRRRFLRTHGFDLAVLILPFLRPLRAVRLVTVVLTLSRRTERWARGRLAVYVGATTVLLVVVAALAVLDAERSAPEATITSFDDALWWATVTITTVGYGDYYPITTAGRFVALGLMIGGIGLIGFVTGSLATWIVERVSDQNRPAPATEADVTALRAEIAALRRGLENPPSPIDTAGPLRAADPRPGTSLPGRGEPSGE